MNPDPQPTAGTPPEPAGTALPRPPRAGLNLPVLVTLGLVLVAAGVGAYAYFGIYKAVQPVNFPAKLAANLNPDHLDERFTDKNGDLVADAPAEKKKWVKLKEDTLLFGTLDTDQAKAGRKWKEFIAHLEKATGKKVELIEPISGGLALVRAMNKGEVHVAMLSTGTVSLAVNTAGFVPCVVPADDTGKFAYQMEILVPADSQIRDLADLKGRTITLASMSSLSAFKAPLVVLYEEAGLLPDRDYQIS